MKLSLTLALVSAANAASTFSTSYLNNNFFASMDNTFGSSNSMGFGDWNLGGSSGSSPSYQRSSKSDSSYSRSGPSRTSGSLRSSPSSYSKSSSSRPSYQKAHTTSRTYSSSTPKTYEKPKSKEVVHHPSCSLHPSNGNATPKKEAPKTAY